MVEELPRIRVWNQQFSERFKGVPNSWSGCPKTECAIDGVPRFDKNLIFHYNWEQKLSEMDLSELRLQTVNCEWNTTFPTLFSVLKIYSVLLVELWIIVTPCGRVGWLKRLEGNKGVFVCVFTMKCTFFVRSGPVTTPPNTKQEPIFIPLLSQVPAYSESRVNSFSVMKYWSWLFHQVCWWV